MSVTVGPWHSSAYGKSVHRYYASNTGAFAGEETIIATVVTTDGPQTGGTNIYNYRITNYERTM